MGKYQYYSTSSPIIIDPTSQGILISYTKDALVTRVITQKTAVDSGQFEHWYTDIREIKFGCPCKFKT